MGYQAVFKRYEIKYMISSGQKETILKAMEPYMEMDRFGRSTIRNIYFDTDDYILARHSIAKPDFKEKLRVRSYERAEAESTVFAELKRKYDHVVYKRRIGLSEEAAMKWMAGEACPETGESHQVADEIDWFLGTYKGLRPALYLSYDREAYRMKPGASETDGEPGFRVTFDENILCRDYDISLEAEVYGESILEPGKVLMEIKCAGGIPMWMAELLSSEHIYKTSFSKYGTAYQTMLFPAVIRAGGSIAAAAAEKQAVSSGAGKHRGRARRHFHIGFGHQRATA